VTRLSHADPIAVLVCLYHYSAAVGDPIHALYPPCSTLFSPQNRAILLVSESQLKIFKLLLLLECLLQIILAEIPELDANRGDYVMTKEHNFS
jgi:hypothetical protein